MITIKLGEQDREALGAPESMQIDPQKLRISEVRALKEATGLTPEDFAAGLKATSFDSIAALVWMALRRAGRDIPYPDLDFVIGEVEIEVDRGEAPAPAGAAS